MIKNRYKYLIRLLPIKKIAGKSRRRKLDEFHLMLGRLIFFCLRHALPIEAGEWLRSLFQAQANVRKGVGILKSDHRRSLAIDLNYDRTGRKPTFPPKRLSKCNAQQKTAHAVLTMMGKFWEKMGGQWGGRFTRRGKPDWWDPYHFGHPHTWNKEWRK